MKTKTARTHRINPTSEADLARVWTLWTGADPGQKLTITLANGVGAVFGLPSRVVMLGRVSKLIGKDGSLKNFGATGPFMVTDARMGRIWLLSHRGRHLDFRADLIAYLARKPKNGDRGVVEYIHKFDRSAHAVMDGQAGELKGSFQLTERGIEG